MLRSLFAALILVLAACGTTTTHPAASTPANAAAMTMDLAPGRSFPAVPTDSVVIVAKWQISADHVPVLEMQRPEKLSDVEFIPRLMDFRVQSARRGANAIYSLLNPHGRVVGYVAVVDPGLALRRLARADSIAKAKFEADAAAARAAAGASGSGGGCTGDCSVHVRGYYRKDGTYVRPHTRSRPGSGSSGRRRS